MTDWSRYGVPEYECFKQAAWDRRHKVRIAYKSSGVSLKDLGKCLGIGPYRVGTLIARANWEIENDVQCPAMVWLEKTDKFPRKLPKVMKAVERLTDGRDWLRI